MTFQTRSSSLSGQQLIDLCDSLPPHQTMICGGVAKIHSKQKDELSFAYTGLFGALIYVIDRKYGKRYIYMKDLNDFETLFEMQVTNKFIKAYLKMNDYFFYFFYKQSILGFSFAESDDASSLKYNIAFYAEKKGANEITDDPDCQFLILGKKRKIPIDLQTRLRKPYKISTIEHMEWDRKHQCIDFRTCGDDFKYIFDTSGIKPKHLLNEKVSLVVLDTLIKFKRLIKKNGYRERDANYKDNRVKLRENVKNQLSKRFRRVVKRNEAADADRGMIEGKGGNADNQGGDKLEKDNHFVESQIVDLA